MTKLAACGPLKNYGRRAEYFPLLILSKRTAVFQFVQQQLDIKPECTAVVGPSCLSYYGSVVVPAWKLLIIHTYVPLLLRTRYCGHELRNDIDCEDKQQQHATSGSTFFPGITTLEIIWYVLPYNIYIYVCCLYIKPLFLPNFSSTPSQCPFWFLILW